MTVTRRHDNFFKTTFENPEHAAELLRIAAKHNDGLAEFLAEVNLDTLQPMPGEATREGLSGATDLAFRVNLKGSACSAELHVGVVLEHKSYKDTSVLQQLMRYYFEVILQKAGNIPTVTIVVYNGNVEWDPLAEFRRKPRAKFQGRLLPFECAFVNLAEIDDRDCTADDNAEAAIGALTLKYAFNPSKFEEMLPEIERMLRRLDPARASTLVGKIELYLGEYITRTSLEELKMAFKSIGQRLGFVSAGDERRAAVKAAEKALAERLRKKHEAEIAAKDGEIAAKEAEIRRLSSLLAQKV